ncbi:hypothetical protein ABPG74_021381 [Tetrahymena malaccensis]
MNPTINNNSVVFTSPTNKGYSLSDFNDYDYNYQTAEKKFGEPIQVEFTSPVVQIDSISKLNIQATQQADKPSIDVLAKLSKNYSSNDLRLNNHQSKDKQQATQGERLLSENSSFVRKSLNNSINVNQLSPKLSPMRNSLVSMKSSIVSESTSTKNQKQSIYFPQTNKQIDNQIGVPIQIIPSQVNHIILSENTKNQQSKQIIIKENKLRNSITNLSSISQSPINKDYSSKNFNTAATATSINDNKFAKNTEYSLNQQVLQIQSGQNVINHTTNNANSSFNSIQQHLGDFLHQDDSLSGHNLNTNNYQYTQTSDNSLNKYQFMKLFNDPNSNNLHDHKQFLEIQQKMLFLITENEKLIEYNESLMKENKLLKQGRDSAINTHRLDIDDQKRKYDLAIENRDKEIRQLRDQLMRQEIEYEERRSEFIAKEKQFYEREQNLLRKMTLQNQEIIITNQNVTTQQIQKKVVEEANLLASEEIIKRQENRIKELEDKLQSFQEENRKLVQTLASHDATAREQLAQAHSQSLEKIEKIIQTSNLDKKLLEEQLRKELQVIQSEKSHLQQELSNQRNESLQVSQMVNNDIQKLESDKLQAISRINEIELKCERLIVDVQQLNTLLAERLEQIKSLEAINKDLEDKLNSQQPQLESNQTERLYLSEENKLLKIKIKEMEERQAEIIENKYEQEQLVEKYQQMTEQSQKMNQEYLQINEAHLLKIQELEKAVANSTLLLEKLDQKDHYITQLIQTIEQDKLVYQSENEQLILEIKRLESNHQFEIEQLKQQDVNCQKIEEQDQIISQIQQEKENMRQEFDQMKFQFEKDIQELNSQIDQEKEQYFEQIQNLKVEISNKKDNFVKLQELEALNAQLLDQLDIKEKAFQQTCINYEERINQEVQAHTYQINITLTNLKSAMRQLEEENNAIKLDLDAHKRELDRQRIRYQDLLNEKEQVANQYERQIHTIAQQSERTIHNLKSEKEREMQFLQREHQRMQSLLQEKAEIISRLQSYSANQYGLSSNTSAQNSNQYLTDRYQSKNNSISTGLTSSSSQQNLLKKNSSLSNLPYYDSQQEQDENNNLSNTVKRQPGHYLPPLPQQPAQNQINPRSQYMQPSIQRYSSVQNINMQSSDIPRYDNSLVEENDMLNKMILERCRNIVEGKIVPENQGPYASKQYGSNKVDDYTSIKSNLAQQAGQSSLLKTQNNERI